MKNKNKGSWIGLAALLATVIGVLTRRPERASEMSTRTPLSSPKRKKWWKAVADALQFFVALLTISSFITALQFFKAQNFVTAVVHKPIAVTDFEAFSSKDAVISDKILPCVYAAIPRTLNGEEYTINVGTAATLMNPPFRLEGKRFVFIYEIGSSSPSFSPIYSTAPAQAPHDKFPDAENPFTEPAMLNDAKYNAGYGVYDPKKDFSISLPKALSAPSRFKHYLQNRYGIVMFEAVFPKRGLYLVEDILPTCIDKLEPPHLKRAGYYRLADSRDIWNIIELRNTSNATISDATLTIDRPGQGDGGLVEATVKPDGGEVLHKSTYFSVVRFPTILEESSKVIIVKTKGRPIDESSLEVSHARTSSLSIPWMISLTLISFLLSVVFLIAAPGDY